jgi:hypothetical protein
MNLEMIDLYINAVVSRLPEDIRDDVSRELRTNIEDMLPEDPCEEDVSKILEGLGDPKKLAREYNQTKRYLIGPELYDNYISVLKLVTVIAAVVLLLVSTIKAVFQSPQPGDFAEVAAIIIQNIILSAIQGIMQVFIGVTLIFAVFERTGVHDGNIPFKKKKWTVEDLYKYQTETKRKISRTETAFSTFFIILITTILCFQPQIFGIYVRGKEGLTITEPIFVIEQLKNYNFIILLLAFIGLCVVVWKFVLGKWNIPLAIANTINNSAVCIFVIMLLGDSSLINQKFITAFADVVKVQTSEINTFWFWGVKGFIIIFILISCWDSINGFIKCRK